MARRPPHGEAAAELTHNVDRSTNKEARWCTCYALDDLSHVHVHPLGDLIEHDVEDNDGNCVCGPSAELIEARDGGDGWMITHHSLDGREATEPDPRPG